MEAIAAGVAALVFIIVFGGFAVAFWILWKTGVQIVQDGDFDAPHPKASKRNRPEFVECDACGRTYHIDWGRFCPNCTGAD